MLAFLGITLFLGVLILCGTSPLDEPKSNEARLDTGIGVVVVAIALTVVLALLLG